MSVELFSVLSKWQQEFPNVVFEHGPSTESDRHHVVCCEGFSEFNMSHRQKVEATLRGHGVWYVDSVTTGASVGNTTVYLNLRRLGMISKICARVPCLLLSVSFVASVYALIILDEPDIVSRVTRCVEL